MAVNKLWLKASDIPELTSISGNIDADTLLPHVYTAQKFEIKRILGRELYNYIDDKIQTSVPLDGEYLILFNEYIVDILVYYSAMIYMPFTNAKTAQSGSYKSVGENISALDGKEINRLTDNYRQFAVAAENAFYEYIDTINLPEYPKKTDNQNGNVTGWF